MEDDVLKLKEVVSVTFDTTPSNIGGGFKRGVHTEQLLGCQLPSVLPGEE